MSWLYSQALVVEYLGENFLDGEQSAPLNGSNTQQAYCAPDKMTDFSRLSRYGMTYKPLTETRGEELLTLYREVFRAKTSAQQEKAQELTESEAGCGEKWHASFAKYDPDLSLWKTPQCSLLGDSEEFSETWPQWGLMRNGECWEQIPSDFLITEPEFGWLPTPIATDWKGGCSAIRKDTGRPRTDSIRMYIKTKFNITYPHPNFLEALMEWPQGWTDLKPLAMDKSHCAPQQHGESSQKESE
jgi:hypothetical protein